MRSFSKTSHLTQIDFPRSTGGPFPPQLREPDPEGAIKHPKARTLGGALVRGELLTQGEIFQDERLSMDEEAAQKANEQDHPGILAGAGKSNDFRLDGVFADYGQILGSSSEYRSSTGWRRSNETIPVRDLPVSSSFVHV